MGRTVLIALIIFFLGHGTSLGSRDLLPCLHGIRAEDALLVADPEGNVIYKKNEAKMHIPASTLKILTASTATASDAPALSRRLATAA